MKIMIVDDENLALNRLKRLLNELGYEDIDCFIDVNEAIHSVIKNKYDIAFLDISMPQMSGLDLASYILDINSNTFIVFQTAYEEYALEAYNKGGIAYLLKPTELLEIKKVMDKISSFKKVDNNENKKQKFLGKRGDKIYLIDFDDIYYVKADLDEVIVKIKESDVYVKKKIGDTASLLPQDKFFRVHRSYIVNVDKIKSMKSVEQSKLQISFDGIEEIVTSSKDGAKEFREYLEKRVL